MDVNMCVVYFTDKLVIEKFTGVLDTKTNYIDFDDEICGWYGISYENLGKITEEKVFCLNIREDVENAKETLALYVEDGIEGLKQDIEYLEEVLRDIRNGFI